MMKRNQGSALAGKSARSRRRDMLLRVITHDVMILPRRVETEQVRFTSGLTRNSQNLLICSSQKIIPRGFPRNTSNPFTR
jgi:hypothetical protein